MYLNVLMRTNNRPLGFLGQMQRLETCKPDRVIISVHNKETRDYVEAYAKNSRLFISIVDVETTMRSSTNHFRYNLYINELISAVSEGFVWCIDDDDQIAPDAISIIKQQCTDESTLYIFKIFLINRVLPKNWKKRPVLEDIGTPNFVIHHLLAKSEKWDDQNHADGKYIQRLYDKCKTVFIDKIIYNVKKASFGL